MFGTTKVKDKKDLLKYVSYGTQQLMITEMEVQEAKSGTPRVVFKVQSQPVTTEGWQGADGAAGRIGTVRSSYLKTDTQIQYFCEQVNDIARALGVYEEVKALGEVESINDFVDKLRPLFTNKFAWFTVAAEEYIKADGANTGISLTFPRYRFVSDVETGVAPFDSTKDYHYKKANQPSMETDAVKTEEEPF